METIDKGFNAGIDHAWRLVNAEKRNQERKSVFAKKKKRMEEEEESFYCASILERVAEIVKSAKRGETNGTPKE